MSREIALIIEDDKDMGTIFAAAMEKAGYSAEVVADGRLALERLAELVPDLIILDLHLPQISGPQILDYIRQNGRLQNVPVIIATADPHLADTLRDDVSFVLDKPVSFKQLSLLSERLRTQSNNRT